MGTHYIYCKPPEGKRMRLLTSKGTLTDRRIFAARFDAEKASALISEAVTDNPGWTFEARAIPATNTP